MASIASGRTMLKALFVAGVLAGMIALMIGLIWVFQERIAFQPPRGPWPGADDVQRVDYKAGDGQPLFAYVVGLSTDKSGLLLSFHGNADLAVWQIDWAEEIARRTGMTVMLAEYRGYMGLPGRPAYEASKLDAEAAYTFAQENLNVPGDRIAFFGHSLGSAVAAELALKHSPAALLLQSPFTSAREMARRMTGYQPAEIFWKAMSRLHFNTLEAVSRIDAPVSVAHGGLDRLIPLQMGERVFKASKIRGSWLLIPDAAHNDVAQLGGEAYWKWILDALRPVVTE